MSAKILDCMTDEQVQHLEAIRAEATAATQAVTDARARRRDLQGRQELAATAARRNRQRQVASLAGNAAVALDDTEHEDPQLLGEAIAQLDADLVELEERQAIAERKLKGNTLIMLRECADVATAAYVKSARQCFEAWQALQAISNLNVTHNKRQLVPLQWISLNIPHPGEALLKDGSNSHLYALINTQQGRERGAAAEATNQLRQEILDMLEVQL